MQAGVSDVTTLTRMGGKPNMVMRSFRVPLKLWDAAKAAADEREENISDVIREALERYVEILDLDESDVPLETNERWTRAIEAFLSIQEEIRAWREDPSTEDEN